MDTTNELLMQLGWSGILAGAVTFMFRTYHLAQASRIEALESHAAALQEELARTNERIWVLLQDRLETMTNCPEGCPLKHELAMKAEAHAPERGKTRAS